MAWLAADTSKQCVPSMEHCVPVVCLDCQRCAQGCQAGAHYNALAAQSCGCLSVCPRLHISCRIVKGVFAFPDWDMLVVATSSHGLGLRSSLGKLRVMHLPSPAVLEGAEARRLQSMATPHRVPQPTVDLQVYVHDAHTQQILAAARQVGG
jgi:hypothetical protein